VIAFWMALLTQMNIRTFHSFLKDLFISINKSIESSDTELKIMGIGVGAPIGNYYSGTIEDASNLNWKGIIRWLI